MESRLTSACGRFLSLLPECGLTASELAGALSRFEIYSRDVDAAAAALPENYELDLLGVRLLISEYLRAFCELLSPDGPPRCEVSVPAPLFLIMALQRASAGRSRFFAGALLLEVVLRSFFLYGLPFGTTAMHMHFCGLNRARSQLMESDAAPELLLQFGVLCDECLKCGEGAADRTHVVSVCFPKGNGPDFDKLAAGLAEYFLDRAGSALGAVPDRSCWLEGLGTYLSLQRVQSSLEKLNARRDRRPLGGNSFALAQTVQLTVFDRWDGVLRALETLAEELENAPADDGVPRMYCFYTPFLQPWVDTLLRKDGVRLMGSAVFLHTREFRSLRPGPMTADWLRGMGVRGPAGAEAERIAQELGRLGCCAYLTGMFGFDRWMGPASGFHTRLLAGRGIPTYSLRTDFWNEASYRSLAELENIGEAVRSRSELGHN